MFGRIGKPTDNISSHCMRAQTYKYQKSRRLPPECGEPGKKAAWRQKGREGGGEGAQTRRGRQRRRRTMAAEADIGTREKRRGSLRYTRPFSWRPVRMSVWRQTTPLSPRSCLGLCAPRRLPSLPRQAAFCVRFSVPISFARRFYPNWAAK